MAGSGKATAVLSIALGLIMMAPSAVQAQAQGAAPQERDPAAMYKVVGADDGQLDKIRTASKQFEEDSKGRAQALYTLIQDMRQLSLQPSPDSKTVLGKQDEINKINSDQATAKIKLLLTIRSILRDDQKQKLVDMLQKGPQAAGAQGSAPPKGGAQ